LCFALLVGVRNAESATGRVKRAYSKRVLDESAHRMGAYVLADILAGGRGESLHEIRTYISVHKHRFGKIRTFLSI